MKICELQATEKMFVVHGTARMWTGVTDRGTKVHLFVAGIAVPSKGLADEEFEELVELVASDPMITSSVELGIEDTTFKN